MSNDTNPSAPERKPGTAAETAPEGGPRIYVASLSDYNAGILHGEWIPAAQDADALAEQISVMLAGSPTTRRWGEPAEEWAIHDYEGFGPVPLGEWEPIERVSHLARGIVSHGEAFAAWWSTDGRDDSDEKVATQFEQDYQGEYSSLAKFGEHLLDDYGFDAGELSGVPEGLAPYVRFDVGAWTRDMELGGDITTVESQAGVYVFWNR